MILTRLQFDRNKHSKHPEVLKNLKQSELEQLLITSIDQFGLVHSPFCHFVTGCTAGISQHQENYNSTAVSYPLDQDQLS